MRDRMAITPKMKNRIPGPSNSCNQTKANKFTSTIKDLIHYHQQTGSVMSLIYFLEQIFVREHLCDLTIFGCWEFHRILIAYYCGTRMHTSTMLIFLSTFFTCSNDDVIDDCVRLQALDKLILTTIPQMQM